jgi:hypothetical protein
MSDINGTSGRDPKSGRSGVGQTCKSFIGNTLYTGESLFLACTLEKAIIQPFVRFRLGYVFTTPDGKLSTLNERGMTGVCIAT